METTININPAKRIPQSPQKIEQHLRAWTNDLVWSQTQQMNMSSARKIPRRSKIEAELFVPGNTLPLGFAGKVATITAADDPTRLTPARKSPQKISLPACLWSRAPILLTGTVNQVVVRMWMNFSLVGSRWKSVFSRVFHKRRLEKNETFTPARNWGYLESSNPKGNADRISL